LVTLVCLILNSTLLEERWWEN